MSDVGVPISDATRVLLCDFAAADIDRPLLRMDADWREVLKGVYGTVLWVW